MIEIDADVRMEINVFLHILELKKRHFCPSV